MPLQGLRRNPVAVAAVRCPPAAGMGGQPSPLRVRDATPGRSGPFGAGGGRYGGLPGGGGWQAGETRPWTFAIVHRPERRAVSVGDWKQRGVPQTRVCRRFVSRFCNNPAKGVPGVWGVLAGLGWRDRSPGHTRLFLPHLLAAFWLEVGAPQSPPWCPPQALGGLALSRPLDKERAGTGLLGALWDL